MRVRSILVGLCGASLMASALALPSTAMASQTGVSTLALSVVAVAPATVDTAKDRPEKKKSGKNKQKASSKKSAKKSAAKKAATKKSAAKRAAAKRAAAQRAQAKRAQAKRAAIAYKKAKARATRIKAPRSIAGRICPTRNFAYGAGWGADRGHRDHAGMDMGGRRGTPLFAIESGRIDRTKRQSNGALQIVMKGRSGAKFYYGHMQHVFVRGGQKVRAGQVIGTMGDSGSPGAVHLHFEYWKSGRESAAVNPTSLLRTICRAAQ